MASNALWATEILKKFICMVGIVLLDSWKADSAHFPQKTSKKFDWGYCNKSKKFSYLCSRKLRATLCKTSAEFLEILLDGYPVRPGLRWSTMVSSREGDNSARHHLGDKIRPVGCAVLSSLVGDLGNCRRPSRKSGIRDSIQSSLTRQAS